MNKSPTQEDEHDISWWLTGNETANKDRKKPGNEKQANRNTWIRHAWLRELIGRQRTRLTNSGGNKWPNEQDETWSTKHHDENKQNTILNNRNTDHVTKNKEMMQNLKRRTKKKTRDNRSLTHLLKCLFTIPDSRVWCQARKDKIR